jgi:integrase
MKGSVYKRCGCRGADGKQLGASCPRLKAAGHGAWYAAIELPPGPNGKRSQHRRRLDGVRTKAEAFDALRDLLRRSGHGQLVEIRQTVGDWLAFWLTEKTKPSGASAAGPKIRATTARVYRQHVDDYLVPTLGHIRLDQLRSDHISAAYDRILAGHPRVGPTTLRRIHACLSSALSAAVRARRLDHNPAAHVDLPAERWKSVEPWAPEELGAFLDAIGNDRLAPLFELMAFTGLRRGEALGLRWVDVDLERRQITVVQQLVDVGKGAPVFGPPKTRSGEGRVVFLAASAVGALLAHQFQQDDERQQWGDAYADHGLVFAREDGRPVSPERATKSFARLVQRSGSRRVRLHDLRHGTMSLWAAAGIPLEIASKMAGHSSYAFTVDRYQHTYAKTAADAADAVWSMVPRAPFSHRSHIEAGDDESRSPESENAEVGEGAPSGTRTPNPLIKRRTRLLGPAGLCSSVDRETAVGRV